MKHSLIEEITDVIDRYLKDDFDTRSVFHRKIVREAVMLAAPLIDRPFDDCFIELRSALDKADDWSKLIIGVLRNNPNVDWSDYPDGITPDEAARLFNEDIAAAWEENDKLQAKVNSLTTALETALSNAKVPTVGRADPLGNWGIHTASDRAAVEMLRKGRA